MRHQEKSPRFQVRMPLRLRTGPSATASCLHTTTTPNADPRSIRPPAPVQLPARWLHRVDNRDQVDLVGRAYKRRVAHKPRPTRLRLPDKCLVLRARATLECSRFHNHTNSFRGHCTRPSPIIRIIYNTRATFRPCNRSRSPSGPLRTTAIIPV